MYEYWDGQEWRDLNGRPVGDHNPAMRGEPVPGMPKGWSRRPATPEERAQKKEGEMGPREYEVIARKVQEYEAHRQKVAPVPQKIVWLDATGSTAFPKEYAALDAKAQEAVNEALRLALDRTTQEAELHWLKKKAESPKPPERSAATPDRRCRWAAGVRLAVLARETMTIDRDRMEDPRLPAILAPGWEDEARIFVSAQRAAFARTAREWPRCEEGGTVEVALRPCTEQLAYEAVLICDRCGQA